MLMNFLKFALHSNSLFVQLVNWGDSVECIHSVATAGAFEHDSLSVAFEKEIDIQFHMAFALLQEVVLWPPSQIWKMAKLQMENIVYTGSCSTPLFNQLIQLPRVFQGFQSKRVVRDWPDWVSVLRKLESWGTIRWIAFRWHSAVPVPGLDQNVHTGI